MKSNNFNKVYADPLVMALVVVGLMVFAQLLFMLLAPLSSELIDDHSPWVVSVALMLFYVLFNSISTFANDNLVWNWSRSLYGFLLLGVIGYLMSWAISGKSLNELAGFRDIILIVVIGFVVLKTIATSIMIVVLITRQKDSEKK